MKENPIGVFDSGVGGLTVVREILKQMPFENIIYFADTLHLPYGERKLEEIKNFALKIIDYLISKNVKAVIMGCNISSAVALKEAKKRFKIPIFGLIQGGIEAVLKNSKNGKVGIIATSGTVKSNCYQRLLKEKGIIPFVQATPEFVPLVESGKAESKEAEKIARNYLRPLLKNDIDTLLLGCTHYSYLLNTLKIITDNKVTIVEPVEYTVRKVKNYLKKENLLNDSLKTPFIKFFVSGKIGNFKKLGKKFLNIDILDLEKNNIFK
jgi:glutamate racemase